MMSPNCGPRRAGATPDIIVLHYTAMPDWRRARDWLCNPEAEVSAHYIISPQGEVVQLVAEEHRAWHAGAGSWCGITDVNSRSIGIELSNDGSSPFAAPLMDALERLLPNIMQRWNIPQHRVIAHSDLALGRKIDPGPKFDWARLERSGLALHAYPCENPRLVATDEFLTNLERIGYDIAIDFDTLLSAFRLRHRQGHEGPFDAWDCEIAIDMRVRFALAEFNFSA